MFFAIVFLNDLSLYPSLHFSLFFAGKWFLIFFPSLILIQIILKNTLHVEAGYLSPAKTLSKTDKKELICEAFSDYI